MIIDAETRQSTGAVLAVAAGLMMAALPAVLHLQVLAGVVNIAILLALGATLRQAPRRGGILAAIPVVAAGLLRAVLYSPVALLLVLLLSPLFVIFAVLVATAGSNLAQRRTTTEDVPVDDAARAQRRRGWMLVVLAVAVVSIGMIGDAWASSKVNAQAKQTAIGLEKVLKNTTIPEILAPGSIVLPNGLHERAIENDDSGVSITVEVTKLWQVRCVVGHLTVARIVSVDIDSCPPR